MYLLAVLASISAKICLIKSSHLQAREGARGNERVLCPSISASHLLCGFGQLISLSGPLFSIYTVGTLMAMTICEGGEDRLVLWEKGLVSDKTGPWEERARKWAVARGHMQMRRTQGHLQEVRLE